MARYYMLAIQPTLFGETAVVRASGHIGKVGGEMTEVFSAEKDAVLRFLELVLQKRKRGYRPARSCGTPTAAPFRGHRPMKISKSAEKVFRL
ncbi:MULTISPECIES: WGR domain-containing protein [Agrobacterium]|nr:WGR domain-containing protein [Agrobacterium deltaense]